MNDLHYNRSAEMAKAYAAAYGAMIATCEIEERERRRKSMDAIAAHLKRTLRAIDNGEYDGIPA